MKRKDTEDCMQSCAKRLKPTASPDRTSEVLTCLELLKYIDVQGWSCLVQLNRSIAQRFSHPHNSPYRPVVEYLLKQPNFLPRQSSDVLPHHRPSVLVHRLLGRDFSLHLYNNLNRPEHAPFAEQLMKLELYRRSGVIRMWPILELYYGNAPRTANGRQRKPTLVGSTAFTTFVFQGSSFRRVEHAQQWSALGPDYVSQRELVSAGDRLTRAMLRENESLQCFWTPQTDPFTLNHVKRHQLQLN